MQRARTETLDAFKRACRWRDDGGKERRLVFETDIDQISAFADFIRERQVPEAHRYGLIVQMCVELSPADKGQALITQAYRAKILADRR